jgi:peptidoglycan/LPS O-acetylase OafA/YrhL
MSFNSLFFTIRILIICIQIRKTLAFSALFPAFLTISCQKMQYSRGWTILHPLRGRNSAKLKVMFQLQKIYTPSTTVQETAAGARGGGLQQKRRASAEWYLLPIYFGFLGGLLMFFVLKDEDRPRAKHGLILGIIQTIAGLIFLRIYSHLCEENKLGQYYIKIME